MKQKLTPKWLIIKLTGLLFAAYSAYNVFIIIRDNSILTKQAIFISSAVALTFAVLAAYALTFGVLKDNPQFLTIRRITFIIALWMAFLLKLRMAGKVIAYFDITKPYTVLYCAAYGATQAALLILLVYSMFIRKAFLYFPKSRVILPVLALTLFLCSLILEAILFFAYGIGLEANLLRTAVMRPVFYLGLIGLSVYFLFLPKVNTDLYPSSADDDFIVTLEQPLE